ncbi:ABC transporter permease [Frondihabitans sucicola]|uniref:ABC transporter permease n=1 Tax=Frondihabitans sucicola TaxID=1268041 RepID=A0ABN6XXM4_9MICO|nr:sugar ABC transporter permease [Frondihabitans sucicola]BDZ49614.1 ABC transporter permease [Frondihabitans sucicola]
MTATLTPRTPTTARSRPSRRRRGRSAPYFFLLPALVLFVLFMVVPIIYAAWLSLQTYRIEGGGILGTRVRVFTGLSNYVSALTDPDLLSGFGHLGLYAVIAVPVTLGLALLFALLLDVPAARGTRFSRTAIFIPYAVPGVVAALLWGFLYLPGTSPFSDITNALGLGSIPFLKEPGIFGSMANISIWGGVGFNMIIIFTSLRGIPADIYEAARLDGADERQIALSIKIPLVVPALVLTAIFSLIGALQLYGEPTTLKPMTSIISQTWVPLMTIYKDAFLTDDLPSAAALSVILALGTVVLSAIVLGITNRRTSGARS